MYDIIIVGAGPAGMSAALFAARSNKNVLLLEGHRKRWKVLPLTR